MMTLGKRGLGALGLSFLVGLAFSAFAANSAQAKPNWYINLSLFHGTETLQGIGGLGTFLVKELGLELTCHKSQGIGTISGLDHGLAILTSEECEIVGAKAVCIVPNITAHVLLLAILHSEKVYILATPALGSIFAEIDIEGGECSVQTEDEPIAGSGVAGAPEGEAVVHNTLFPLALETLFPDGLKYGTDDAVLDMTSGEASLSGANIGEKWGVK